MKKNIFLAAPFNGYMNYETGRMQEDKIQLLKSLLSYLRKKGHNILNAHEREQWGEDWFNPEKCTPLDFMHIIASDIIFAIPGNPPSGGVHIELGWASAFKKKIVILLEESKTYSNLVLGLDKIAPVSYIRYNSIEELFIKLSTILQ